MEEMHYELPPFLSAKDISKYMCISLTLAYQILRSASFPTIRIGRKMLADKNDLLKWIDENKDRIL